ncbi:MAG: signal peptidase I [Acidobacteria bacterium]|nr:signal peptidase I [Acidobacteriota bacterium]
MSDEKKNSSWRESLDSLLVTVILALFGITFVLQAFKIPSSSMEDTLLIGDHLLVNKFIFADTNGSGPAWLPYRDVHRGDIVVFKYPFPPHQHFVKRVIGLPGDRLKIVERVVHINGAPLDEPYKIHRLSARRGGFQDNFPPRDQDFAYMVSDPDWAEAVERWRRGDELLIPPGKYFVMGDNRDNSQDSRYWGFVDRENIIGRPLLIYWSFDGSPRSRAGRFAGDDSAQARWDNLVHFFSRTRWKRLLRFVR